MNQNGQYGYGQQNPGYQGMPYQNSGYQGPQYNNNDQQRNSTQSGHTPGSDMRYQEPTFQQYCADPTAPRSFQALISAAIKARIAGYVKSIPKMLLIMVPFTVFTFIFNVFFWSVLNDTMWAGSGTWGRISFMPYLIGGAVYSGSRYKGVTPFEVAGLTTTGKIVAPLTFALSLLFSRLVMRKKQGGNAAISRDFASVKKLRDHYEKALSVEPRKTAQKMNGSAAQNMPNGRNARQMQEIPGVPNNQGNQNTAYDEAINNAVNNAKEMATTNGYIDLSNLSNNIYMRIGLCCAIIFGFIIRNPFAVPVFAILLYFSFGQGGESDIGQMYFRFRSADAKLYDGRKQIPPKYSEGMLIMYYMSIGLFMYSAVNVVLWILFNYNYYIRFIVSGALVAYIFSRGGRGKKQIAGMISSILFIVGGFSLFCAVTVFADDNGWSESGKTLKGLIHNNGFPKAAWSSLIPAIFWDIGILLGWPLDIPIYPEYIPPQPPTPVNPYDFEGRPQGWNLNNEGDVSFTDPTTGKQIQYGLTGYDENGKGIYIGPNGSYYGQDELINNYNNALDHQEYFRDIHNTEQRNVAEQQAMNHAQWEKERQTGETEMSKLVKEDIAKREAEEKRIEQEKKHEEYVKKLEKKYGTTDHKEIKKQILKDRVEAGLEYEEQMKKEAYLESAQNYAEFVEKFSDVTIDALGEITGPVGKTIKNVYKFTKPGLKNIAEATAENKSVFNALVKGVVEGGVSVFQDKFEGAKGALVGVGTDTLRAGFDAWMDGEDIGDAMAKGFTESAINNSIGYVFDKAGEMGTNYLDAKVLKPKYTDALEKEMKNINKFRSKMPLNNAHNVKLNLQLRDVANTRLTKIKDVQRGTGFVKDMIKGGYQKYIEDDVKAIGDMVVSGRQIHRNDMYNIGQGLGMKYREVTGYRKKL